VAAGSGADLSSWYVTPNRWRRASATALRSAWAGGFVGGMCGRSFGILHSAVETYGGRLSERIARQARPFAAATRMQRAAQIVHAFKGQQRNHNPCVAGSNPSSANKNFSGESAAP
jgi:hypothetical protein